MQTTKLSSVEGIRGIACFLVLLSHLSLTFFPFLHAFGVKTDSSEHVIQSFIHNSPFGFFFSGSSAVFIFFVLSGYILTQVALKPGDTHKRIISMGLKRYPRLMIPALVSCLLAYISFSLLDLSNPDLSDWINKYGEFDYSIKGAIYSGTIDVFFLSGKSPYNPVLWTMQIELIGSFIIYLLCLNKSAGKIPFFPEVLLIILTILAAMKLINFKLGLGIASFYAGYLFSIHGKTIPLYLSLTLLFIGLYLAGAHNDSLSYSIIYGYLGENTYLLCNFLSGFFIVYTIIFNEKLSALFSGKLAVFMGKVSFSVYLIHMPIISTLSIYLFTLFFKDTGIYEVAAILASIITIVCIYICSIFFYNLVDSQSMKISDSFAKKTMATYRSLTSN